MIETSIVIPVYNDAERLKKTLDALKPQVFNEKSVEVFVVDNGSDDGSDEVAKKYSFVTLLREVKYLGSPYSARNRGIEKAKGDVIVLLDSKCTPSKNWLSAGLADLEQLNADLIGGCVCFELSSPGSTGELYDSIVNVKMEQAIRERGVAMGGNLFISQKVFDSIGLFPEGIRSGGDLNWTFKATNNGFSLKYSPNAKVYYPARNIQKLIKKQWRVSQGHPEIWKKQGKRINLFYLIALLGATILFFPFINKLERKLKTSDRKLSALQKLRLYTVHYLISLTMKIGSIYGYIKKKY